MDWMTTNSITRKIMGMTISKDPQNFFITIFPFMQNPNDPRYNYLYNNNTDWRDLIYKNTASTDHLFRVEGGDNIAKYDLSLGVLPREWPDG